MLLCLIVQGETMEQALCDVLKNVRIGKILIQTNQTTNEPEVNILLMRIYFITTDYCFNCSFII